MADVDNPFAPPTVSAVAAEAPPIAALPDDELARLHWDSTTLRSSAIAAVPALHLVPFCFWAYDALSLAAFLLLSVATLALSVTVFRCAWFRPSWGPRVGAVICLAMMAGTLGGMILIMVIGHRRGDPHAPILLLIGIGLCGLFGRLCSIDLLNARNHVLFGPAGFTHRALAAERARRRAAPARETPDRAA
jgi:hypothetical protein